MDMGVIDTLVVNREDQDLRKRVKLSLYAKRAELANLLVRVDGGTICLAGLVSSFYVRQLALSAVRHVAGVRHVVDEIEVPVPPQRNPR